MGSSLLNIIIEDKIPFIKGVLDSVANVTYLPAGRIDSQAVRNADALIVRTRNKCDRTLLQGSRCRFIASATIGLDHVDLDYCSSAGITVVNAPGCNAPAVAQYVLSSVIRLCPDFKSMTIGIIGVGHIGSIVNRWAQGLGMKTLLNDPPRQLREPGLPFVTLETIIREADIITVHTPLTEVSPFPTRHLITDSFIHELGKTPVIINAARGPIVNTQALVRGILSGKVSKTVIDCWENESDIDRRLLRIADIATPHIAGYSLEGKIRATRMVVEALTEFFSLPPVKWDADLPQTPRYVTARSIIDSYNPFVDSQALKAVPSLFETLRNDYDYRHEPV